MQKYVDRYRSGMPSDMLRLDGTSGAGKSARRHSTDADGASGNVRRRGGEGNMVAVPSRYGRWSPSYEAGAQQPPIERPRCADAADAHRHSERGWPTTQMSPAGSARHGRSITTHALAASGALLERQPRSVCVISDGRGRRFARSRADEQSEGGLGHAKKAGNRAYDSGSMNRPTVPSLAETRRSHFLRNHAGDDGDDGCARQASRE
ncbi:hypothetical protein RJ55_05546 [Drechmeria coniospora]|nr:hypothetical protein RJ55_05546 [Drechmeria coniospora]